MKTWQKLRKNPFLWQRYFTREKIFQAIRDFFQNEGFHEVETPLLVPSVIPESYLDVFETYLLDRKRNKKQMFLTASPEASLKKLLVAGIGNCFEITKSFRNTETGSSLHNPEFSILEWYRINADYKDLMKDCERLIIYILKKIKNPTSSVGRRRGDKNTTQNLKLNDLKIIYQNQVIDLSPPWERISIPKVFYKYTGVSFDNITQKCAIEKSCDNFPVRKIYKIAKSKGYQVSLNNTWEEIFNQIFLNEVELHLGEGKKPIFVYDYPRPMAALAKLKPTDKRLAERVELYIGKLEIGDGYSELTDFKEQKDRFASEIKTIRQKKKTSVKPDLDFLEALKIDLPKCAGMALGLDRLIMLFMDVPTIQETLFFPLED